MLSSTLLLLSAQPCNHLLLGNCAFLGRTRDVSLWFAVLDIPLNHNSIHSHGNQGGSWCCRSPGGVQAEKVIPRLRTRWLCKVRGCWFRHGVVPLTGVQECRRWWHVVRDHISRMLFRHTHTYSLQKNPDWSTFCSYAPEIRQYFQKFGDKSDLHPFIKLNSQMQSVGSVDR